MQRALRRMLTLSASLLAGLALADVDLNDFDDDLMRSMDDTIKSFEPNITARNSQRALADAQVLWDGFKWTEAYFSKQPETQDAVEISRQALEHTAAVMKSLAAQDFESAAASARSAVRTCRACHDLYKPS